MSNRSSRETANLSYLTEIKAAVKSAADAGYQQERQEFHKEKTDQPLQRLDDLDREFIFSQENSEQLDYGKLFSYLDRDPQKRSAEYHEERKVPEKEERRALMDHQEAQQHVEKKQSSIIFHDGRTTHPQDKERFYYYQLVYGPELLIHHDLCMVKTGDVDYSNMLY